MAVALRPAREDLPPRASTPSTRPTARRWTTTSRVQLPVHPARVRGAADAGVEVPGFEADDVIATLARQAVERGPEGRRRLRRQGPAAARRRTTCVVLNPGREGSGSTRFDRKAVEEKWGVPARAHRGRARARRRLGRQRAGRARASATRARATSCASSAPLEAVLENADKVKRAAYREGLKSHRGGGAPLEAARHAAHGRSRRRSTSRRSRRQEPDRGRRPRPLQGARVPGARARVRAGGGARRPAEHRLLDAARGDRGRRRRRPARRAASRSASW